MYYLKVTNDATVSTTPSADAVPDVHSEHEPSAPPSPSPSQQVTIIYNYMILKSFIEEYIMQCLMIFF